MLKHTLIDLLSDMRSRAQVGGERTQVVGSLAGRIYVTRCIALYSLVFYSMRRGYDLSFTTGLHILNKAPGV